MLEQIFLKIMNMSITAGYCVLIVLILRLFMRKVPKIYSYSLWLAVFFRLVCPVSIQSALSLVKIRTQSIPQDIGMQPVPQISSGYVTIDHAVNNVIQQTLPAPQAAAGVNPMQIVIAIASIIWFAVLLLLAAYSIGSYIWLHVRLRGASLVEEDVYEIYQKENLQTPFVLGIIRPRIYLPSSLEKEERLFVLEHEKTHIRRKDYLVKQAAFLISCVHWFQPLVWLSFYLMCRDMEMSCDESVIRRLGRAARKDYSVALLSLASGKRIILGSPLAFGEGSVKHRIVNVLSYKKPALWVSILAAVVIAAVILGLSLNPGTGTEGDTLENVKMASGVMSFADGGEMTVELWMTAGRYYDETMEEYLPSIYTYSENYEGIYALRTVNEQGEVLSQTNLKELWQEANDTFNFPREFTLEWADYNADGCPDFSIGVPQSSSNMGFQLITVRKDGSLERLSSEEIPMNNFEEFSVVFEHDAAAGKMPLTGTRYNNATGEVENIVYQYNDQTGLYEEAGADNWSDALYYTGYLDESPYTMWRDYYSNLDYDFDNLTDRIYRDIVDDTISYEIIFGNGDHLFLGAFEDYFMSLEISATKITYNGAVMILFVGQHNGSTDPYAGSEIALYAKLGDTYQRIKLPKSSGEHYDWGNSENEAGYYMTESYDEERDVMTVNFKDIDYQMQFTPEEEVQAGHFEESHTAFDAAFLFKNGVTCVALYQNAGGKWRNDVVSFVMEIHPSERSDMSPYDAVLLYVGWADGLEEEGFEITAPQ